MGSFLSLAAMVAAAVEIFGFKLLESTCDGTAFIKLLGANRNWGLNGLLASHLEVTIDLPIDMRLVASCYLLPGNLFLPFLCHIDSALDTWLCAEGVGVAVFAYEVHKLNANSPVVDGCLFI